MSTFSCAHQDMATQEQSLSRTRELQLEEKIKVVEEERSDLEAEVEKLEKYLKQLEILPSDDEQLAKVHIHVPCSCVSVVRACVCGCVLVSNPDPNLRVTTIAQLRRIGSGQTRQDLCPLLECRQTNLIAGTCVCS